MSKERARDLDRFIKQKGIAVLASTEAGREILAETLEQEFNVGSYRCRYGRQHDRDDKPNDSHWSVWLWNAHYWELLIPLCEPAGDFESAKSAAQWHLTKP